MREYLMMEPAQGFLQLLGTSFDSKLVTVDDDTDDKQGIQKHLEYHPMVNSRTHLLGQSNKILNATFRQTYDSFLAASVQKKELGFVEKMVFVYYLQLQDRMQEAIDLFNKLQAPDDYNKTLRIQYDYLQAYFDFF